MCIIIRKCLPTTRNMYVENLFILEKWFFSKRYSAYYLGAASRFLHGYIVKSPPIISYGSIFFRGEGRNIVCFFLTFLAAINRSEFIAIYLIRVIYTIGLKPAQNSDFVFPFMVCKFLFLLPSWFWCGDCG